MRKIFTLPLGLLAAGLLWTSEARPSEIPHIREALERRKTAQADYWFARYLGRRAREEKPERSGEFEQLVERRALAPSGFLSSEYDAQFLNWFEKSAQAAWGVDEAYAKPNFSAVELQTLALEDFFVTVTGSPRMEAWYVTADPLQRILIPAISPKPGLTLHAGKLISGAPTLYYAVVPVRTGRHSLHRVWKPVFQDADHDGNPEFVLRYNLLKEAGYSQFLEIYKIDADRGLVLWKRFEGRYEGVARLLADGTLEVGWGKGSTPSRPHMEFDLHHLERWTYEHGRYHKVWQEDRPHLLLSDAWKEFYLE